MPAYHRERDFGSIDPGLKVLLDDRLLDAAILSGIKSRMANEARERLFR